MRNIIILVITATFIIACKDEGASGLQSVESILSVSQVKTIGECDDSSYCKFEFKIEKDSIYTIKSTLLENIELPNIINSYFNKDIKIDSLTNLINFDNIDNEHYNSDCNSIDGGCYELFIITNYREIYVKYGQLPEEFIDLDDFLRKKRLSYEF